VSATRARCGLRRSASNNVRRETRTEDEMQLSSSGPIPPGTIRHRAALLYARGGLPNRTPEVPDHFFLERGTGSHRRWVRDDLGSNGSAGRETARRQRVHDGRHERGLSAASSTPGRMLSKVYFYELVTPFRCALCTPRHGPNVGCPVARVCTGEQWHIGSKYDLTGPKNDSPYSQRCAHPGCPHRQSGKRKQDCNCNPFQ